MAIEDILHNFTTPEEFWKGSFFFDIQDTVKNELLPLFAFIDTLHTYKRISTMEQINQVQDTEAAIYEKVTGMILREIRNTWTPAAPFSLEYFLVYPDCRLKGLLSGSTRTGTREIIFYNFFDNRCDFPFPEGLKEKATAYAHQVVQSETARVINTLQQGK